MVSLIFVTSPGGRHSLHHVDPRLRSTISRRPKRDRRMTDAAVPAPPHHAQGAAPAGSAARSTATSSIPSRRSRMTMIAAVITVRFSCSRSLPLLACRTRSTRHIATDELAISPLWTPMARAVPARHDEQGRDVFRHPLRSAYFAHRRRARRVLAGRLDRARPDRRLRRRRGRQFDHAHRRLQLTFPAILIALLVNGVANPCSATSRCMSTLAVLVVAIG